jgi:hypothetical protein
MDTGGHFHLRLGLSHTTLRDLTDQMIIFHVITVHRCEGLIKFQALLQISVVLYMWIGGE